MWPFDGLWPKTTLDWLLALHAMDKVSKALEEEVERQRQLADLDRELARAARRVANVDTSEIERVAEVFEGLWVEDPLDEGDFDEADDPDAYVAFEAEGEADAYAGFEAEDDPDAYSWFDGETDAHMAFEPADDPDAYSGFDSESESDAYACFADTEDSGRKPDSARSAQPSSPKVDYYNGLGEAPLEQEEAMRFSGGVYTFGISVKPGVYEVSRVSGEGGFGFSRAQMDESYIGDIDCYPLSFFQGKRYETHGDVLSFPESVHIEAGEGSSMVITGGLVVDIKKAEVIQETE